MYFSWCFQKFLDAGCLALHKVLPAFVLIAQTILVSRESKFFLCFPLLCFAFQDFCFGNFAAAFEF